MARPGLGDGSANGWTSTRIFSLLSAITVVEIVAGIQKLRRAGATGRAFDLDAWLDRVVALYGERILSVDTEVAKIAGALTEQARANGQNPGLSDIVIAATAVRHRCGLMSDNLKHFEPLNLEIQVINPLEQRLFDGP
jgi:predicted nucleic acid-binding protein